MRRVLAFGLLGALAALPQAWAQIHGTPPSVTSIGSSSTPMTPGVPASVTSLGPAGFADSQQRIVRSVPEPAAPQPRPAVFFPGFFPYYYSPPQPTVIVVEAPPTVVVVPQIAEPAERAPAEPLVVELQGGLYVERSGPRAARAEEDDAEAVPRKRRSARRPAPRPQPAQSEPLPPVVEEPPATVLVFRDGSRRDVRNYAIVGEIFWDLSERRARKILLADLDLHATAALNDQRGVDFRLPSAPAPNQVMTRP